MSGNGRADNGRGNNRRRHFRYRGNGDEEFDSPHANSNSGENSFRSAQKPQDRRGAFKRQDDRRNSGRYLDNSRSEKPFWPDRPKWVPPKVNTDPLPTPDCPYCGKIIQDISQALSDKDSGVPVHFDCAANRIASGETLEKDESITYLGGGRFGIVAFKGRTEFVIKKIIEWENKDKRAEWRSEISERYSII